MRPPLSLQFHIGAGYRKSYKTTLSSGHVVSLSLMGVQGLSEGVDELLQLVHENPARVALKESRDEVAALAEFLCREGFWSDEEAEKVIADTRDVAPAMSSSASSGIERLPDANARTEPWRGQAAL